MRKMKRTILFMFFLVGLIAVASVTTSAEARTVGVNAGDWFKYGDINVTWSSNDPNASKVWYGIDLEKYNQTEWVRMEVTQVSGPEIILTRTEHLNNGTENTFNGWINIETGHSVNATFMLTSADLSENDTLYTSGNYSNWMINETTTRVYAYPAHDGIRETHHFSMTSRSVNYTISPDIEVNYSYSIDLYWDKATGILVEKSFEMTNQTGEYLTTCFVSFKIIESNRWVVPEFSPWLVWLAVMGARMLPTSTIFILFLSMFLSFVTSFANRMLVNQEQLRAWRKEVADWTSEFRKATRSGDKKLLAKIKKQQPRITKLQSKMTWQSMKVSFIFMIPFLLLWYLFLTPLYSLVPAVALIPNIPGFWEGKLPLFLWYLFCSFLFGTLWSRLLGLAVGTTGATD